MQELLQSARASHDLTGESELGATVTVSPLPVFINSPLRLPYSSKKNTKVVLVKRQIHQFQESN